MRGYLPKIFTEKEQLTMVGILSIPSRTSELLAEALDIPLWYRTVPPDTDFLIRWGSTYPSDTDTLNSIESIKRSSDKALCRQLLYEAGIPVPEQSKVDFPVIGRRRKHRAGSWFFVCRNAREVRRAKRKGAVYFSQFYPKTNEYRVHIGSGKVILMSIKEGDKSKIIWNKRKTGFTLRHLPRRVWRTSEELMDIVRLAKRAIRVVGLDFGTVDIMCNPTDHSLAEAVVSEINTAPSLSPLAIKKYVRYFQKHI